MVGAMSAFDLDSFLPYRFAVVAGRISRGFAKAYGARFGLTIPEWRILAHLSQTDAVSVREINLRADLEKSKASRAAQRLEEAGLISKRPSRADRRLVELSLTARGREVMTELAPLARAYEAEVLAALAPDDRAALDRALTRLREVLA